ncbi:hypothetical protein LOK49_LG01G02188 [Camellia lanceoleosa]|uniref:Uncharacterized protein n=1 Tax=Camellia lanceoleosa TaxID=1840588 RepID=A0ACC0ISW0_9ERIC|nr:hypothetical protein LOK49_LG01G02188 [Camellia lanceoleosa]
MEVGGRRTEEVQREMEEGVKEGHSRWKGVAGERGNCREEGGIAATARTEWGRGGEIVETCFAFEEATSGKGSGSQVN